MQVYVEELKDLSDYGITTYSLIEGMDCYRAEVRASGVYIVVHDLDTDSDSPLEGDIEKHQELVNIVVKESYEKYK